MVWFPGWTTKPISNLSLSSSGLIALADLSTIAQRTAITGGSRWLDSLILAPGLHYQQAADELVKGATSAIVEAVEERGGRPVALRIHNAATANYIRKIARPGETVTLDVGSLPNSKARYRLKRSDSGMHATVWAEDEMPDLGWVSHLLYITSPFLTVTAVVFDTLLQDWWALGLLCALMLSRVLNIWVIKQRAKPVQPTQPPANQDPTKGDIPYDSDEKSGSKMTTYSITIGDGKSAVKLHGTPDDLKAITEDTWLRAKTYIEGYLEAAAKLLVYLVAAMSGNMTQAGQIIQVCLLLTTAGLLALSNAHAKSFRMNGRVAAPRTGSSDDSGNDGSGKGGKGDDNAGAPATLPPPPPPPHDKWDPVPQYPGGRHGRSHRNHQQKPDLEDEYDDKKTDTWPSSGSTTTETGSIENDYYYQGGRRGGVRVVGRGSRDGGYDPRMDDWAEKGQIKHSIPDSYPFDDSVDYS